MSTKKYINKKTISILSILLATIFLSCIVWQKVFTDKHPTFKSLDDFAKYIAIPYASKVGSTNKGCISDETLNKAFIAAERWWNEGTRTYSKKSLTSEIDPQYQPQSTEPSFELPTFEVDKNKVIISKAHPNKDIEKLYLQTSHIIFPVHPSIVGDTNIPYLNELKTRPVENLQAIPTASSRTVVDNICPCCIIGQEKEFHTIKLHLPRKISRFYRNLGPKTIAHSVMVSEFLSSVNFDKFAYLPESLGVSFPTEGDKRGWGFIIREMTPRPIVKEKRLLIPFFSLYANNPVIKGGDPLLATLIKSSKEDPKSYVLNRIIFPLIECWIITVKQQGIILESHGQNTLLEIDQNLLPSRIVQRDFDNYVDCTIRKSLNLSCENLHPDQIVKVSDEKPKGSPYSLIYDSSIGHHMLDFIANTMQQYFGIDPKELHLASQKFFSEKFPDFKEYFPKTIYYYASEPSKPNTFPLIDTKEMPRWRPTY